MSPAAARSIEGKARWQFQQAYRPGYKEAADRAGIDVHVLPIALSGGWHKEARDFIAKVQHRGDKAAQVGADSEKCRFEGR